jgi:DNA-binding NarL/FixJ family response regulator
MATPIEAGAVERGYADHQRRASDVADLAVLAVTLVTALEQALQAAQRLLGALTPPADACVQSAYVPPRALSRREGEVLRLLVAAMSNRQIAAALFLSPRTAQRHVANIYLKLGTPYGVNNLRAGT